MTETQRAEWTWDEPDDDWLAPCRELRRVDLAAPFSRADLAGLGMSGIQFGSWDERHPSCLNTDVIGLTTGSEQTETGSLYVVDEGSYFVRLDARERLPFADGCLDWVYAEHFIEHLSLDDGVNWLREVRRVLAPGGLVRLTTPDLATYAAGYVNNGGFFTEHHKRLQELGAGPDVPRRRAWMLNQIFFYHGHKWIYDLDELRYALTEAGFAAGSVVQRAFATGARTEVAALDRPVRNHETIYVEASR